MTLILAWHKDSPLSLLAELVPRPASCFESPYRFDESAVVDTTCNTGTQVNSAKSSASNVAANLNC